MVRGGRAHEPPQRSMDLRPRQDRALTPGARPRPKPPEHSVSLDNDALGLVLELAMDQVTNVRDLVRLACCAGRVSGDAAKRFLASTTGGKRNLTAPITMRFAVLWCARVAPRFRRLGEVTLTYGAAGHSAGTVTVCRNGPAARLIFAATPWFFDNVMKMHTFVASVYRITLTNSPSATLLLVHDPNGNDVEMSVDLRGGGSPQPIFFDLASLNLT